MARYIDVDKLINKVTSRVTNALIRGWLASIINETPTTDVAEVKHGEWKRVECGTICTNCNRVYDKDFEFSHEKIKTYFKHCPECGAKMDGGE